jgi:signal transduction histidine kinase
VFRYNTHGLLNVAAALFNITLGVIVLANNPRASLQRTFFGFSVASSLWVGFYGLMSLLKRDADAPAMLSYAFLGIPLIPALLYTFSRMLLGKSRLNIWSKIGFAIGSVLALVFFAGHQSICTIQIFSWGRYNLFLNTPFALVYFWTLIIVFIGYMGAAYADLYKGWRTSTSAVQKRSLRNILIAFSIGYYGMLDFATAKGLNIYPMGSIALTGLLGTIAYAVIRHQFLDVNMTLRRASLIVLIYVFLIGFSIPALFPIARRLLNSTLDNNIMLFLMFSALFGAILSTGPLIYAYLERHTFWLKKHITTGLTHELKSPISSIRGAVDFLQDQLHDPQRRGDNVGDYIAMIDKNTTRLESYVKDLLQIAKGQEGIPTVDRTKVDIIALIKTILESQIGQTKAKGLNIQLLAPEQLTLSVDKEKIQQTISNLLSNAIKFAQTGTIQIRLEPSANHCMISIQDPGRGIPAGDLDRVFERFYQGRHSTQGSGIGLTIAKAWVEAHGGKIWAESEGEGKGATVAFTLPG